MEDPKNCQITLNPEIEMNENWYKIIFHLPGDKDLNTYGKIYVNLKNQIVVVTTTRNGITRFQGIGSLLGFILNEVIDNNSNLYQLPITFYYNRADKIMRRSGHSIFQVASTVFNSKEISKIKFFKR